jgi:hypothetical protein
MSKRTVIVAALIVVVLLVWGFYPNIEWGWPSKMESMVRLWGHGGWSIEMIARRKCREADNSPEGPVHRLAWEAWSESERAQVRDYGLRAISTETIDRCLVTTFINPNDLDARWFYLVPADPSSPPWFRVVGTTRDYRFCTSWPPGADPDLENIHTTDPLEFVRQICRESGAAR